MNRKVHRCLASSLLIAALMTACDSSAPALKQEKATTQKLRMEIELAQQKHEHAQAQEKERYERLQAEIKADKQGDAEDAARLKRDLDAMRERLDELEQDNKKLQQEYDQFKTDHRVRVLKNPAGMALPDFLATDGQSYVRPVISSRSAAALTFRHAGGASTLAWSALPADLQTRLLAGEVWSEPVQEVLAAAPAQDPPTKSSIADSMQARMNFEAQKRQERDAKTGALNQMRANRDLLREQLSTQRGQLSSALRAYRDSKGPRGATSLRVITSSSFTAGGKSRSSSPSYTIAYPPESTSWIDNRDLALRDCRAMRDRVLETARKLAAADHAYKSAGGY
jgi:hypothetical protein